MIIFPIGNDLVQRGKYQDHIRSSSVSQTSNPDGMVVYGTTSETNSMNNGATYKEESYNEDQLVILWQKAKGRDPLRLNQVCCKGTATGRKGGL
ncbi:unnamed protein product [Nezara viridula]|uniref:Uncharacterized protein n=1 Tax=Nezara viridula TaxID=85310 RepID=A0A9P0MJX8_NEZVI|nr:unnamed protein product [Nezara viridula]